MNYNEELFLSRAIYLFLYAVTLFWMPIETYAEEEEKQSIIQLEFSEEDSIKYITAKLNEFVNDSIGDPIADVDLYFYVERTFSLLPIGDIFNTTDENGEVSIVFPSDLPGNTEGNVKVIVKLEDAEDYSDTETSEIINWGVHSSIKFDKVERSLWAAGANAPISLLLLTNTLIAVAWGIIFYILYKIYQISRL